MANQWWTLQMTLEQIGGEGGEKAQQIGVRSLLYFKWLLQFFFFWEIGELVANPMHLILGYSKFYIKRYLICLLCYIFWDSRT